MHRNKSVDSHLFSMVPRADIPRSGIRMEHVHKTTFNAGHLIPIYVDEMLPGDTFNLQMTAFCRLATPITPVMDNLHLETFFFFTPIRLVWENFNRFMGEQPSPGDSTSFLIPQLSLAVADALGNSIFDYFGLPTEQMIAESPMFVNTLPLRCYNYIWNEWFRDQNLQDPVYFVKGDGPDDSGSYELLRRGKRHDYFTSCLPFLQKGPAVSLPLSGTATITGTGVPTFQEAGAIPHALQFTNASQNTTWEGAAISSTTSANWLNPNLAVDLSTATASTINLLRMAFQTQRLLERDARGGTRYTEIVRAHFGVTSPDARLQRPEYLGGGHAAVSINPIAQTSATTVTGTDTPQGSLAAMGTASVFNHGFTYSATEHGYVIGLCCVRADLTYQQGLRKLWSRSTRLDFYWPVFANLGEQAVFAREIFCDGGANDSLVFGYQERWAEYRYFPSLITGLFRSVAPQSLDVWHYSQEFAVMPTLNSEFIVDRTDDVVERSTAITEAGDARQFLFDGFFVNKAARPMPIYSVPGMVDHL